jgi:carbon monoxide dehydrogenase subunit G
LKLSGTIEIGAPPRAVWDLLLDPEALAGCVPGVQEVRQVDPTTWEGRITAQVGPMEGKFGFTSVITSADYPHALEVVVDGTDSVTKSRLETLVTASVAAEDGTSGPTTLTYDAQVKVKGRLAILGEMILRATASLMIAEATKCLRSRLEARAA